VRNADLGKLVVVVFLIALLAEPFPAGIVLSGASPHNTSYEGTSRLRELLGKLGYEVRLVDSWTLTLLYPSSRSCRIILIVSPEKPFTPEETSAIAWLVRSGSGLIIADEGTYSNAVLEALGIDARILGGYVSFGGSQIFHGIVNVSGADTLIYFAYASRVVSSKGVVVVYRGDAVLGVKVSVGGSPAYVFGDGSIMTNAALSSLSPDNPYVKLVKEVLNSICLGGTIYLDSSKYGLKPVTTAELMNSNLTYFAAAVSNPFRYLLTFSENTGVVSLSMVSLILSLIFSLTIVGRLLPWKGILTTYYWEITPRLKRRGYVLSRVRSIACSEDAPDSLKTLCGGGRSKLGTSDLTWLLSKVSVE
jgi:hypothetical protein